MRKDPAATGMVEALASESETSSGNMADMRVLPHLMSSDEINDFFSVVKLDEWENQWARELEQGITRPTDELAGPGPRGRVEFVPAIAEAGALVIDYATGIDASRDMCNGGNNIDATYDGIFSFICSEDCGAVMRLRINMRMTLTFM